MDDYEMLGFRNTYSITDNNNGTTHGIGTDVGLSNIGLFNFNSTSVNGMNIYNENKTRLMKNSDVFLL